MSAKRIMPSPDELKDLETVVDDAPIGQRAFTPAEQDHPTVHIYGCGGCGTNLINKIRSFLPNDIFCRIVDTSKSNLTGAEGHVDIIDGSGSGKVRAANLERINKFISSEMFTKEIPGEINIVVFSLSGGSGSIAGPLLIKELHRRNKTVVAVVITDTSSQLDTENTSKTFQSLQNICEHDKIYLPVMVFDNEHRRSVVDDTIKHRLVHLCDMLRTNIFELDKSDKINWLRPDKAIGVAPGITGMHLSIGVTGDHSSDSGEVMELEEDHLYDSILLISNSPDAKTKYTCRVKYHGINIVESSERMVGLVGFPISDKFIDFINASLNKFRAQASQTKRLSIQDNSGSNHSSGLVI